MNFSDALKALKESKAIRRKSWSQFYHIKMKLVEDDNGNQTEKISAYWQEAVLYSYDSSIILSKGWIIVDSGSDEEIDFPQAIELLRKKFKIRLKEWPKNRFVELGEDGKSLVLRQIVEEFYLPSVECFIATDWEIYDD